MTHAQTKIKERPILFSGPMVRAILEGRKTQTRRVMKPQPYEGQGFLGFLTGAAIFRAGEPRHCPYGKPGDRLWVRETWGVGTRPHPVSGWVDGFEYRADEEPGEELPIYPNEDFDFSEYESGKWKPSIHMPRAASRILLEITDVRVERLQEISEEDALAEGVLENPNQDSLYDFWHYGGSGCWGEFNAVGSFNSLWESINGPESWEANPWVWAVTFKKINP